jgi:hypothetical protein
VVVTHPFHPLAGQRVEVVVSRRGPAGANVLCRSADGASWALPVAWTDRGGPPAATRLTAEVLAELVGVLAGLAGR